MRYKVTTALILAIALLSGSVLISAAPKAFAAGKTMGQHIPNDKALAIDKVDLQIRQRTKTLEGAVRIDIVQEGSTIGSTTLDSSILTTKKFTQVSAKFEKPVEVHAKNYDLVVSLEGMGRIAVKTVRDNIVGNYFEGSKNMLRYDLSVLINGEQLNPPTKLTPKDPPPSRPPTGGPGQITVSAFRIPSPYWSDFFLGGAQMWFDVYDSEGTLVYYGFTDEAGNTVTGLKSGESYWVWPQDCDKCHGDKHDVKFDHWENGSTKNPRLVEAKDSGVTVGAYYRYVPPPK
jgi:hypothetical protein